MSARETAELLLLVGRLVQAEGMTANSAPPNGWRSATSPAPISSSRPRRHLRTLSDHPWHRFAGDQGT